MRPIEQVPVKFEKGLDSRVNERVPGGLGLPVGNDCSDDAMGGRGCDGSEQGSKDSEAAHGWKIRLVLGVLRRGRAAS